MKQKTFIQALLFVLTIFATGAVSVSADNSRGEQLNMVKSSGRPVPYLFPCTEKLEDPYGVCCHITRAHRDYNKRDLDLQKMQAAGITNVRSDFDGSTVWNKDEKKWTPGMFDNVLASTDNTGSTFLPILVHYFKGLKAWDKGSEYLDYVNYLTRRYKGRIPVWEVMNETDWFEVKKTTQKERADLYAGVLPAIANAIHANDPQAKVMFGGVADIGNPFTDYVLSHGVGQYIDIMNFHFYDKRKGVHFDVPETIIPRLKHLHAMMQKYGVNKPVWMTETGCTTPDTDYHDSLFFTEVVPEALRRLHLDASKITLALVNDPARHVTAEDFQEDYFTAFRDVRTIGLDALRNLSPKKYPVLVPCYGEFFPKEYQNALLQYVRNGGTIILSKGTPFTYDSYAGTTPVADTTRAFEAALHLKILSPSSNEGRAAGAVLNPTGSPRKAEGWNFSYSWTYSPKKVTSFLKDEETSYLTDDNLKKGDTFVPILTAGNDNYTGTVAALYNLGSDLTGNIIVQTRQSMGFKCTEKRQAFRLPRAFLIAFSYGIDKVFWYNLRSLTEDTALVQTERHYGILNWDLSNKQAYLSYQALATTMCPTGSTRPALEITGDNLYTVRWQRPDGKYVTALWSLGGFMHAAPLTRNLEAFDYLGQPVAPQGGRYRITAAPVYFVSDKPLQGFSFN